MSRRSKKITGSILGALGAIVCIVLSAAGTVFLFWYRTENYDIAFLILAVTAAITAFLSLFLVRAGMILFDGRSPKAERTGMGRWVRNTLFAGMITVFLSASLVTVMETGIHGGDTEKVNRVVGLFMIAVSAGTALYLMRTGKEMHKRKIICQLAQEGVLNPSGRFSMVIDKIYVSKEDHRFAYLGNVHGTMCTGDRICVIQPDGKMFETNVVLIQRENRVLKKVTDTLPDEPVIVILNDDRTGEAYLPYSVLSGVRPIDPDPKKNRLESPVLRGYLAGYDEHIGDEKFVNVLLDAIMHSRFLVPVITREFEIRDPAMIVPQEAEQQYPTVSSTLIEDSEVIPVYTDWDALSGWEYITQPSCLQGTKIMTFDEIAAEVADNYTGMVIDPFGPKQFYLSAELLINLISRSKEETQEESDQ